MKFKIATSLFAAVLVLASVGCSESDPREALYTGETSQLNEVALVGTQARTHELMIAGRFKAWKAVGDLADVLIKRLECEDELSGKYIETPHGVLEMKYFFTAGLASKDGSSLANTSVKEMLNDLVKKEDPTKPLSDEELVKTFKEKGVKIARRTVAKYRAELNILPSHLRRTY